MSGDAKMQNAPTIMRQHQEHVQDLEPDRRHRKEVDGNQGLHVIVEEGPPGLGRRLAAAHQVFAHTGLADIDAELEQLAVNPRRSPEWVLTTHGPNQRADLFRHGRSPRLTVADLPGPKQTKAFPVPADDGRGLDDKDAGLPVLPDGAQPGPQRAIRRGQFGSFDGALENAELMAESEDLELKHRTAAKGSENSGRESRQKMPARESKGERHLPVYQSDRSLREPQIKVPHPVVAEHLLESGRVVV